MRTTFKESALSREPGAKSKKGKKKKGREGKGKRKGKRGKKRGEMTWTQHERPL